MVGRQWLRRGRRLRYSVVVVVGCGAHTMTEPAGQRPAPISFSRIVGIPAEAAPAACAALASAREQAVPPLSMHLLTHLHWHCGALCRPLVGRHLTRGLTTLLQCLLLLRQVFSLALGTLSSGCACPLCPLCSRFLLPLCPLIKKVKQKLKDKYESDSSLKPAGMQSAEI